jgi:hypothetical protein
MPCVAFFTFMKSTCHLSVISVLLLIVQLVQKVKGGGGCLS